MSRIITVNDKKMDQLDSFGFPISTVDPHLTPLNEGRVFRVIATNPGDAIKATESHLNPHLNNKNVDLHIVPLKKLLPLLNVTEHEWNQRDILRIAAAEKRGHRHHGEVGASRLQLWEIEGIRGVFASEKDGANPRILSDLSPQEAAKALLYNDTYDKLKGKPPATSEKQLKILTGINDEHFFYHNFLSNSDGYLIRSATKKVKDEIETKKFQEWKQKEEEKKPRTYYELEGPHDTFATVSALCNLETKGFAITVQERTRTLDGDLIDIEMWNNYPHLPDERLVTTAEEVKTHLALYGIEIDESTSKELAHNAKRIETARSTEFTQLGTSFIIKSPNDKYATVEWAPIKKFFNVNIYEGGNHVWGSDKLLAPEGKNEARLIADLGHMPGRLTRAGSVYMALERYGMDMPSPMYDKLDLISGGPVRSQKDWKVEEHQYQPDKDLNSKLQRNEEPARSSEAPSVSYSR